MATASDREALSGVKDEYMYGFSMPEEYVFKTRKGLNHEVIDQMSAMKREPEWMREFRHRSLDIFLSKPMPSWGADLSGIYFDDIYYYVKPTEKQGKSWDDIPDSIKDTFDRLGIPEAERKFLAGVGAQYDSEMVYHSLQEEWTKQGVIFLDTDSGLREHEDLFKEYFGTIIPPSDNKFAALNSAVWSGGSFVYVPKGVTVEIPLQAYFRINAQNMGQFERTLIIIEEGANAHYVEGCTAPIYATDSLHSAVVEIVVKKNGRCRYTTIQNWSNNVYNLVTKRAMAQEWATRCCPLTSMPGSSVFAGSSGNVSQATSRFTRSPSASASWRSRPTTPSIPTSTTPIQPRSWDATRWPTSGPITCGRRSFQTLPSPTVRRIVCRCRSWSPSSSRATNMPLA